MAWIELHQSLPTHKKTLIASDILDIPPVHFMGHVAAFWLWCLDNVPDGNLRGISARMIARAAQWDNDPDKFVDALMEAGFLVQAETLTIHDWHDYAGKLVERRASEKERSKQRRAALKESEDNSQTNQRATGGRPADDQQTTDGTVPYRTVPYLTMEEQEGGAPDGANPPNESPPESTENERAMLHELKQVPGYPLDYEKDLALIRELATDFPVVDLLVEAKKWRTYKIDKPLTKKSNPRLQLRNWCEIATGKTGQAPRAPTEKPMTDQRRKEIELIKELYHT